MRYALCWSGTGRRWDMSLIASKFALASVLPIVARLSQRWTASPIASDPRGSYGTAPSRHLLARALIRPSTASGGAGEFEGLDRHHCKLARQLLLAAKQYCS
jgi:hypothetical protein